MSSYDDFVHISTSPGYFPSEPPGAPPYSAADVFYKNSKADRPFTQGLMVSTFRQKHPKHHLSIIQGITCDFLAFGNSSDDVTYTTHGDPKDELMEQMFIPPARRYGDEDGGRFIQKVNFGAYDYTYLGETFILYVVEGQDAMYKTRYNYLLIDETKLSSAGEAKQKADELTAEASKWMQELHEEILVFDGGFWQKSKELYANVKKASWDDVILEKDKKESIIDDVNGFFNSEARYSEFGVPWKRGVIFYGPPGNGKTITTKALMNDVSSAVSPVIESLYVKSFFSYQGPEAAIRQIFLKARQMAPCLLIFEDIDSLILPNVRAYFLNEVDGLESNHGILMIGSTNHLERLDPGIAKRPSRFDRKYLFDVPSRDERVQYCDYWRQKLKGNQSVDFPKEMSGRIADITDQFSFAYMKEAFVAALLVIVRKGDQKPKYRSWEDDFSGNILWKELKKQIESLRKEMDDEEDSMKGSRTGMWPGLNDLASILGELKAPPIDINVMPMYQ